MTETTSEDGKQQITLVDDQGNEELYTILFTFESEDMGKSYILVYPAGKEDDDEVDIEAYALPKGEDPSDPQGGSLMPIESEKEWDIVESVLNTFLDNDSDE
ncbi:DUF1292 domain-containing protein [Lactobacillus sp. Sy-1]|uniref:DUF1292 domain-containing protein n=1 Tax=Lactobacillus sp. Sy-1 TaxID=2109645 RepID=UPI001C599D3C|nr:DUF1292 domain-containing protein [Lactobacillus sp. Sy-1]MBW1605782.1 DUF1292 domain-containing protein [Lactobacillus sp. Sy-1]